MSIWFSRKWRKYVMSVLDHEVAAGVAWESVSETPEVSMEAGVAYARECGLVALPHPPAWAEADCQCP